MKNEAVELLSKYIQINTTNPPGNEDQAVNFLAEIFDREKIEYKTYEPETGKISIRAKISGSGKKGAIILLNHMDVVPANPDEWSFNPFGGEIIDGYICGRGALDMKGQGIMELMAFLTMKREGVKLNRDLIFLAAADEETGGERGVKYLLENHFQDFEAELVINEGGTGITDLMPNKNIMMIATAEKGPCWLKLTSKGIPGHGSVPHEQNALKKMILALNRLFSEEEPITITPAVFEFFKNIAAGLELFKPFAEDGKEETLKRVLRESGFLKMPEINALVKNTISINVLKSGVKTNIIPSLAKADLDIRLLPGQDADDFINYIREKIADDEIEIEIDSVFNASESSIDTGYFSLIKEVIGRHFPETLITQSVLAATTDSRFFRMKGIVSYGFCPIFAPLNDMAKIHGIDEKISVDNMIKGTEVFTDLVRRLCVD